MARRATVFSRVSVGYVTSATTLTDKDATDTGITFQVAGPTSLESTTMTGQTVIGNSAEVPASITSAGAAGQIAFDQTHVYVATSDNSWSRATLNTF